MIDVQNVRFTYDGVSFALDGVSLHVRKGEFLCILGGNGSGKSTLAKHLNALLIPDEGAVKVQDMATAVADCTYRIRETVGMVFQNPDDQLVASLVEDDVAFGPENLGIPTDELRERVTQALEDVGLSGFERHETHALSGGQKQRVAIAGVLAMNPAVLVLDEASAMLDPRGRAGLMRVCRELHERGMTIVMITHYMEEAAQADRVVVMERGHVALEGTPDEVLVQARALAHLNLDVPFAARLSLDLRDAGMTVQPTVDAEKLAREVLALGEAAGICAAAGANAGTPDAADGIDFPTCEGDADAPALIEFQDVSFTYDAAEAKKQRKRKQAPAARQAKWGNSPDSLWAVRDVSLQVRRGEFLGVAGHTGSGKSTLIQHMNGILKPTSGRVLIDGVDVASKGAESKVRGSIGVVFQYPEHQLFAETVYKDVAFGPRNLGLSDEEVDALVRSSLERVGLSFDELAEKSPFELSGGQKRRVALAGVLAMDPQVLVLDEPAAGLDPASKRSFLQMIARLHDQGLTVVMVSHCMDDLASMCDRVAVMNEGRLLGVGAPERLFLHARKLKEVGLGTTEAQAFAEALRAGGWPLEQGKLYTEKDLANMIAAACDASRGGAGDAVSPSPADAEGQVVE